MLRNSTYRKYMDVVLADQKLELHDPNINLIDEFCNHIPISSQVPRVLEIGGGAGVDLKILQERGYDVHAIDIHTPNVEYAASKGLPVIYMDMHDLRYPEYFFDGVYSVQTFEHALSPFIAAGEMARVLKYGGIALVDVPSPDDEAMWEKQHPNLLYPNQLIGLLGLFGLKPVENLSTKHRTTIIFDKILE